MALCLTVLAGTAGAEERISGTVTSIDFETNTVVVSVFEGRKVTITVSADDTATLKKLKKGLIKVDDTVKVRYITKDGKNVATYFKKPAGC
jgi:acetolactate synthase small subunit